jgi:hypothetical protein
LDPNDRIYAMVTVPYSKIWWVSTAVRPAADGKWHAEVTTEARPQTVLTVTAVRIPADDFQPTLGDPGGSSSTLSAQELERQIHDALQTMPATKVESLPDTAQFVKIRVPIP